MRLPGAAGAALLVLLAAGLAEAQGQVQVNTAGGVATAANAKIDVATVSPAAPLQGTLVDLKSEVRNTGNAAGNITTRFTITPPAGGGPAFTMLNSTVFGKAPNALAIPNTVGCNNCTTVLGTWTFLVEALVNGTVADRRQVAFTVTAAPPAPPGAPGGGGGGGGGAGAPEVPAVPVPIGGLGFIGAPVFRDVGFVRQPVIVEVRPGDPREVDFLVANNKRQDLILQVQSILPEEWVYFPQKAIGLPPNERAFLKAVLNPPKEAQPGDYRVAVKLTEGGKALAETFVILRVKTPAPGFSAPAALRVLDVDSEKNQSRVNLVVRAGPRPVPKLEVVEEIPKILAARVSDVAFTIPPDEILNPDPVVKWTLLDLLENETRTLTYTLKGILPEWSPYIYFPVKQVTASFDEGPPSFKVEASSETLVPGRTGKLTVAVESLLKEPQRVKGRIDPPAQWGVDPREFTLDLSGFARKEVVVTLSVPPEALGGTQSLVLTLSSEGSLRVVAVEVVVRPGGWEWLIILLLVVAGASLTILYVRRQERRALNRFIRLESLRRMR